MKRIIFIVTIFLFFITSQAFSKVVPVKVRDDLQPGVVVTDIQLTADDTKKIAIRFFDPPLQADGNADVSLPDDFGEEIRQLAWSWMKDGRYYVTQELPDPVGVIAVYGGETGAVFLDYYIEANKWGYFYQIYNMEDGYDITKFSLANLCPVPPSNFAIIPVTFEIGYLESWDEAWKDMGDGNYVVEMFDFMNDASVSGVPGINPVSWGYDPIENKINAQFSGLSKGISSNILAFTSDFESEWGILNYSLPTSWIYSKDTLVCPQLHTIVPAAEVPVPHSDAGEDQIVYDSVVLDGSASFDEGGGQIVLWDWFLIHKINPACNITASGKIVTINDLCPGFYNVSLKVTNNNGFSKSDDMIVAAIGCEGDFDTDGDVDGSDLAIFASNFGRTDCKASK